MKRIALFLLAALMVIGMLPVMAAADYRTAKAPFVTNKLKIDGKMEDCYGEAFSVGTSADPVHGTAYFCHDGSYLYVYVDVTDSTVAAKKADKKEIVSGTDGSGFANLRCNDGVTVGINFGTEKQLNNTVADISGPDPAESAIYCAERGKTSDYGRYFAGRQAFAPAGGDWNDAKGNALNFFYYSYTSVETDKGYAVEMKIPFGRDVNGQANDVYALSQTGFSVLVQLTESNLDESCQDGAKAPLGTFVSSNPQIDYGLSVWCAMLSSYESGWDKIDIGTPDMSLVENPGSSTGEEKPGTVIKTVNFDNMTAFVEDVDFNFSSYSAEHVKLSDKYDHTTGSGKSLEMANRADAYARVNLIDMFPDDLRGKAVRVKAWVYVPEKGAEIRLSSYTPTSYGIENTSVYCPADTWTELTFVHRHTDVEVSLLGIAQLPGKEVAPVIYIDDITLTDITESVEMPELDIQVRHNGSILKLETQPKLSGGDVILPMEEVLGALQCVTDVNGDKITVIHGNDEISLTVKENGAVVNGKTITLGQTVRRSNGVIMIPAELIRVGLGMTANWNADTRILDITSEQKNVISIYRNYEQQEIYGFGASISPCSYGLMTMENEAMQKEILDALFGNTGKGAAFSLLRMTIISYLASERADNGVNSGGGTINPAEGVWDFDTYDPQRWVADKALSYNPNTTFLASIWSPPAWMKMNNSVIGQTAAENKLAKEHYGDYATYLATWAKLYKNTYGYNLRFLSIQNEPYINAWYESCLWSGEELAAVADLTVDKLAELGVENVLVGAPEGASIQESYGLMYALKNSKIGFIPTHSYGGDSSRAASYDLSEFGLPLIQTEFNVSYKEARTYTIAEGLKTANNIADCLNNGYGGFLYWYSNSRITGEKSYSCESLIDWNPDGNILYSTDFYVMAQFSRFFRPGDHIIISFSENDDVVVVSSVSATTGKVSAIVINNGRRAVDMKVNGLEGNVDVYVTDVGHRFDQLSSVSQEDLNNYTFGARSVTLLTESDTPVIVDPAETSSGETTSSDSPTTNPVSGETTGKTTGDTPTQPGESSGAPVVIIAVSAAVVVVVAVVVILLVKKRKKA